MVVCEQRGVYYCCGERQRLADPQRWLAAGSSVSISRQMGCRMHSILLQSLSYSATLYPRRQSVVFIKLLATTTINNVNNSFALVAVIILSNGHYPQQQSQSSATVICSNSHRYHQSSSATVIALSNNGMKSTWVLYVMRPSKRHSF